MHKKLVSISFFRIDIAILLGILYTTYRSKRERTRLILTYQCLYIRFPPFLALAYVKSRFGFSKVVNYMLAAFLCAELYSAMRRQCNCIFPLHGSAHNKRGCREIMQYTQYIALIIYISNNILWVNCIIRQPLSSCKHKY